MNKRIAKKIQKRKDSQATLAGSEASSNVDLGVAGQWNRLGRRAKELGERAVTAVQEHPVLTSAIVAGVGAAAIAGTVAANRGSKKSSASKPRL